jgi:pantoate--beta-alanine ligase
MKIIKDIGAMQQFADEATQHRKRIGFVPTMGFLHEGHLSLMRIARARCDILVASIFVNPTQFGENEDFSQYPRDFERDENLCRIEQVDVIFYPDVEQMYTRPYFTFIGVEKITDTMCGLSRPGHFRGVATVVGKLFNIVKPHLAVFGQKDYQQAVVIQQMVRDLNFDVEIITGPIVREADGLALSSRNKYLSEQERQDALILYKCLQHSRKLVDTGITDSTKIKNELEQLIHSTSSAKMDYVAIVDPRTLQPVKQVEEETLVALAVYIGNTRLIDNAVIRRKEKVKSKIDF